MLRIRHIDVYPNSTMSQRYATIRILPGPVTVVEENEIHHIEPSQAKPRYEKPEYILEA